MRYVKTMSLVLLALCLAGAATAAQASAEELGILSSLPRGFTISGGVSKTVTVKGEEIECAALAATGSFESKTSGTASIDYSGCTTEKGALKCRTEGSAKGNIVFSADVNLVSLEGGTPAKLLLGILTKLPSTIVVECGLVKAEIRGSCTGEVTEYKETSAGSFAVLPMPSSGSWTTISWLAIKVAFRESGGKQAIGSDHLEVNFGNGFSEAAQEATDELTSEKESLVRLDY